MNVADVLDDLVAEQAALDAIVADLDPATWKRPTPSPRWTVADQIGHLSYFDSTAALAIEDPPAFIEHRNDLVGSLFDDLAADTATLGSFRALEVPDQLADWRSSRARLEVAARSLANDARIEWYGPSMSAKSFLTARLMEVWAHGQDIVDAVGATRQPTDRLRHIAQLGVITRGWSYTVRGEQPPSADVHVALAAPSGDEWTWGSDEATDRISGSAVDFCLVVTRRRHVSDTALVVKGDAAADWMSKAQAFAGGPTDGPAPRGAR